jgi:hypothetical protein
MKMQVPMAGLTAAAGSLECGGTSGTDDAWLKTIQIGKLEDQYRFASFDASH